MAKGESTSNDSKLLAYLIERDIRPSLAIEGLIQQYQVKTHIIRALGLNVESSSAYKYIEQRFSEFGWTYDLTHRSWSQEEDNNEQP